MPGKDRVIDAIIKKAMEEGKFDNLPGKGQPLNLENNPFVDESWRMAFDILKKDGFALPWMEKRSQIEDELAQAKMALARTWAWHQEKLAAGGKEPWIEQEWKTAQRKFEEKAVELNNRIDGYNLEVPSVTFQRKRINVEREVEAVKDLSSQP